MERSCSVVCPNCGAAAGAWCVRHGRTQPGPLLACAARVVHSATCGECGRVFDLLDEGQAGEWYGGHDCEAI